MPDMETHCVFLLMQFETTSHVHSNEVCALCF